MRYVLMILLLAGLAFPMVAQTDTSAGERATTVVVDSTAGVGDTVADGDTADPEPEQGRGFFVLMALAGVLVGIWMGRREQRKKNPLQ